jgi:hypothetical protein
MGGAEIGTANAKGLGLYDGFDGAAIGWYWMSFLEKLLHQIRAPKREHSAYEYNVSLVHKVTYSFQNRDGLEHKILSPGSSRQTKIK